MRSSRSPTGCCSIGPSGDARTSQSATTPPRHGSQAFRCRRRLIELYIASGVLAALAAIIYVAHLGQAKADAGTGYELIAVTAVVLGGTAITGGRGTIPGTIIGLATMVVLQNGLRLAALPAELAGVLTGALLIVAIGGPRVRALLANAPAKSGDTGDDMRNSQLAVLCGVILASAALIAGSNWWLVRSVERAHGALSTTAAPAAAAHVTVAMMPKAKGDPYFISCRQGAEDAARETGVDLIWDGPTELDPAKQNEVVEAWITRGVNVVAVSVENQAAMSTVLRKARGRGIKVLTWDADSEPDARDFLINQATPQGIGETLTDEAARLLGGSGDFAIVTASLSAANQNQWIAVIKARLAAEVSEPAPRRDQAERRRPRPCLCGDTDDPQGVSEGAARSWASRRLPSPAPRKPSVSPDARTSSSRGSRCPTCASRTCTTAPSAASSSGTRAISAISPCAPRRRSRVARCRAAQSSFPAGRLGTLAVSGDQVLLGKPFVFTKENIDRFDF